ncbi:MAG: hypothetical protein HKN12_02350, partial [Gemmatimonadetes bacterium]|nr:hypothetical protein [Gemmatimonadota bacterium]
MKCSRTVRTGIAAALLLCAASASAQNLALPVPDVSLTTESRRNVLIWDEIPTTDGRDVTGIVFQGFDATTPPINFVGAYTVDCDYRLRVTKEPLSGFDRGPTPTLPNGREVRVKLRYQLWTNKTDIGSPLVEDSLDVRQPDVPAFFDSDLVGPLGLGLQIGDNV